MPNGNAGPLDRWARTMCLRTVPWFVLSCLLGHAPPLLAAAKTAVVLKSNGDRVTCEIKELKLGQIRLKTDGMGTLYVDWDKVVRITSPVVQEVQVTSGERYFGALESSGADGRLVVVTRDGPVDLELAKVVTLRPIRSSFWNRFDGSLDLGGSYTQANSLLQLTPSFSATYGARKAAMGVDVDWTLTRQEGQADSERGAVTLRYSRFFAKHWVGLGRVTGQRNSELGLDLRSELSAGVARLLVSTNHSLFAVGGGLGGNRERPSEGETTSNLEALVIVQWQVFSYNFPKTDVKFSFLLYPSLTESGRLRGDTDLSLKRELFRDFTVGLRFYDSFDNRPATEGAATNDWGATLSIGWTF